MLLLDTHALLWFYSGDDHLPIEVKNQIIDLQNDCCVSVASLWEISIKFNTGKLVLDTPLSDLFNFIVRNQIEVLPIEFQHLVRLSQLPDFHKDPFDRLIISQALTEDFTVATKDRYFEDYKVRILW